MSEQIDRLKYAIESGEHCQAEYLESLQFVAGVGNEVDWKGMVEVFKVTGIAGVAKCYAWSFHDGTEERVVTVLKRPPVTNLKDAVTLWLESSGHSGAVKVSDPH